MVSEVATVFFGGGTPSYLPTSAILGLIESVKSSMRVGSDAEITLEANPDDVCADRCKALLDAGFNRISLGVQSLNDGMLVSLTRRHSSDAAIGAVKTARESGFENISIDLMFGLPGSADVDVGRYAQARCGFAYGASFVVRASDRVWGLRCTAM